MGRLTQDESGDGVAERSADGASPVAPHRVRHVLERTGLLPAAPGDHLFHAFISYSHGADSRLAPLLQKGLQRFAKPWYALRALHVFRDDASLSANPDLWASIEQALDASQYYILLASPQAGASKWVAKEAAHWRETKPAARLLIAVTDGEIVWDEDGGDFDWERTNALPQPLRGMFALEPRITDLRWAHEASDLSLSNVQFRDAVADLAAPLHGRSKDELAGEEVFQQRRTVRIARAVVAGLLLLTAAAVVAAVLAIVARSQAIHQQRLATSRALAAESLLALGSDPQLGLLLAVQSADVSRTPESLSALRAALPQNHLLRTLDTGVRRALQDATWSTDGKFVLTAGPAGAEVWDSATGELLWRDPLRTDYGAEAIFVRHEDSVLTWGAGQPARLWPLHGSAKPVVFSPSSASSGDATVSPDGRLVAAAGLRRTYIWDARTGRVVQQLPTGLLTVSDLSIDRTDSRVVTANGSRATIWSISTGRVVQMLPPPARLLLDEARFSPDGGRVLTTAVRAYAPDGQGAVSRVWNADSGMAVTPPLPGWQARWSEDGAFVSTTNSDGVVDIWNASTGALYHQPLKPSVPASGPALFSPDRGAGRARQLRYVATGSNSGSATIWNAITDEPIAILGGQAGEVTPAGFTPDASKVLTFGSDGTARIWDSGVVQPQPLGAESVRRELASNQPALEQQFLGPDPTAPVVMSSDPSAQGTAILTEVGTGTVDATLPGHADSYVAFDRAGRVMLLTTGTQPVPAQAELRYAHGGALIRALPGIGRYAVSGALSADGRLAAVVGPEGRVGVWEVGAGKPLHGFSGFPATPGLGQGITVKFSPDGSLIVAADPANGETVVWSPRTGRVLNRIHGAVAGIADGAISPDDRFVVAVGNGSSLVHLYRVGGRRQLLALTGSAAGIYDAVFSPDGTLIATTSPRSGIYDGDGSVRVWSTLNPQPLLTLSQGAGTRIEFSTDGHSLVTNGTSPAEQLPCVVCGGFDYLLGLARQHETRQLTPAEQSRYLGR